MKKILKNAIMIFGIVIIIFLINYCRNYNILNKIIKNGNENLQNSNNYHIIEEGYIQDKEGKSKSYFINEFFCKDNIYLLKLYQDGELKNVSWKNSETNEQIEYLFNNDTIYIEEEMSTELVRLL